MDKNLNVNRIPIVQPDTSKNKQKRRSKQTQKRIKRHKRSVNTTWIFPSSCNSFVISNKPVFDCYYTIYRGWSFDYTAFFTSILCIMLDAVDGMERFIDAFMGRK